MKRRDFLTLSAGGLGLTLFGKYLLDRSLTPIVAAPASNKIPDLPKNPPLLRFVSVADTGTGTKSQYAVAQAMNRYHQKYPFNFIILAGDNIYPNGEMTRIKEVFEEPYRDLLQKKVKFYACLGNHDIRTKNGDQQIAYPGFNMADRYYTFRQGVVQFFALDTNQNQHWDKQLIWLKNQLSRSDAPYKVVFGHHPIYSSGVYGVNPEFIEIFTPIFRKYKVQLYINGHEHNYERTKPIDGTTYLICGGGSMLRPVGRSNFTALSASQLSFAAVDIYPDRFFITAVDTQDRVFDRGMISL